ncbi:AAA family ATPase [Flexivirga caeni]|uniref:Kinase n=1 Tax=Flexivirga caeni TaxID=2294115 RepID=A0A3M9M5P6_9MICO|nr:AAA family ATPase [Flexivirga caeni]RNI20870.1 kinase [Flexivirga caeni]
MTQVQPRQPAATASVGATDTTLVVLRGPSRAGKSSLAMALRDRPMSVVGQDHLRRIILKERDKLELTAAVELIDMTVRFCLDHGKDVVLEGILWSQKYGEMVRRLVADHRGRNLVYYLQVDFDETVARHTASSQAAEWTADAMRGWWSGDDRLGIPEEVVLDASLPAAQTLARIAADLDR